MSHTDLSRRHFLGAAAASAAAALPLAARAASTSNPAPAKWDQSVDVVILGCGGAGMMAACQAHDAGAKVAIFDKGASPYHTATCLCGGLFTACGTKAQKADPKIKDSWEAFAEDIMAYGNYMSLKEPVYGFTKHSGEAFDWLADHGLAAFHLEPYAGHTNTRAHRQETFKGRDYIDCLVKQLNERGLKIEHHRGLKRFFFDEKANRVLGVAVAGPDGKRYAEHNPEFLDVSRNELIVTNKCEDPATLLKWADAFYTDEASLQTFYGSISDGKIQKNAYYILFKA